MFSTTVTQRALSLIRLQGGRWDVVLPQVVDACLWSLVVLAPFVWGGRHDAGRFAYALLVAAACTAWIVEAWLRKKADWTFTPAFALPALAAAWLVLQMTPLPIVVIEWLSPRVGELLPLWQGSASAELLGRRGWTTLSLNPAATQSALAMLLCYTLLFFVALQRFKTLADVALLLRWLATAAVAMAGFGLLQYFTSNGLFFWVYDHPYRSTEHFVCGSFVNRNHFASFLAMGAAAICFTLASSEPAPPSQSTRRPHGANATRASQATALWATGLAMVLFALAMSFSRGGVAASGVGAVVLAIAYWRGTVWSGKQLVWLLLAAAILGGGLSISGDSRLTDRLDDLTSGSLDDLDRRGGRRLIWSANLQAIANGWLTGAGAGAHRDIYPVYLTESWPKVFTHAESCYLQIATEMGLPGVLLLASAIGCMLYWSIRAWRNANSRLKRAAVGAILAALAVSATHSVVDFVWYIPATMTVVVLLLVALFRLAQPDLAKENARPSAPLTRRRLELSILVGWGAVYMLTTLAGPALASGAWAEYMRYSALYDHSQQMAYDSLIESGNPATLQDNSPRLEAKARSLYRTVHANPSAAGAHVRLAQTLMQLFDARSEQRDNRIGIAHLHATVTSGSFESAEEVEQWLTRAVGDDLDLLLAAQRHAQRAVQLSPLEGPAYVCLANVSFMDDPTGKRARAYMAQAAKVRPQDGHVLFEVGKHYLISGDIATAIDYWRRCFQQPGEHRLLVVAALAGRIPAKEFLDTFHPDWHTLRSIWQRYYAAGNEGDLEILLAYAQEQADDYESTPGATAAAHVWRWLAAMYRDRGNAAAHLACLERALAENPTVYAVRHDLALALYNAERFDEAEPHLRWCLGRHPENKGLRTALHRSNSAPARRGTTATRRSPPSAIAR